MTIEDLKKSAAESGVCCANCKHCFEDQSNFDCYNCVENDISMNYRNYVSFFCAEFEPNPQPKNEPETTL